MSMISFGYDLAMIHFKLKITLQKMLPNAHSLYPIAYELKKIE